MKTLLRGAMAAACATLLSSAAYADHATDSAAIAGTAPEQACVTWSGGSIGSGSLIPCGTGGSSLSIQANAAAQTSSEGATTDPLSMDLSRHLRVIDDAVASKLDTMITALSDTSASAVKIDHTTPGTTDAVVVSSSTLPTGAATAANQATAVTSLGTIATNTTSGATRTVVGNVASVATDSGNPVKVGCVYNFSSISLTAGQRGDVQCDASGNLRASLYGSVTTGADEIANNIYFIKTVTSGTSMLSASGNYVFNDSTSKWDRQRGDANGTYTAAATTAASGVAPTTTSTTAVAGSLVGKSSAGNLYGFQVTSGATAGFVMIFDATSAPADGTVTPKKVFTIAANATIDKSFNVPIAFSTGIVIVFSTTGPFTKTSSTTAFISADVK